MRMEPEQARRMVGRDVDAVVDRTEHDRAMLVGGLRRRHAVGGVEDRHEAVVAEGRIPAGRRARGHQQAMRVQVGRVEVEVGLTRFADMAQLHRIEQRQLVDEPDLQRVALLQCEPRAAVVGDRRRARGAAVAVGRAVADLVDPAGRMNHVAVR